MISEPGIGSTFWFAVRVGKAGRSRATFQSDQDIKATNTLILSHNETSNKVLTRYMDSWGVPYTLLADHREGQQLGDGNYQLVIVDFAFSGAAILAIGHQKGLAVTEQARYVALCAHSQQGDRSLLQAAGFNGFLSKPIRASKFHDCLLLVSSPDDRDVFVTTYTVDEARNQSERHVLVVEDNLVNQKVAQGMLKKLGCHVEIANNGQEAYEVLEDKTFDLVFMDRQIPVLDGLEAARMIRKRESESGIPYQPIVAMTAHALNEHREASRLAYGRSHNQTSERQRSGTYAGYLERSTAWIIQNYTSSLSSVEIRQLIELSQRSRTSTLSRELLHQVAYKTSELVKVFAGQGTSSPFCNNWFSLSLLCPTYTYSHPVNNRNHE